MQRFQQLATILKAMGMGGLAAFSALAKVQPSDAPSRAGQWASGPLGLRARAWLLPENGKQGGIKHRKAHLKWLKVGSFSRKPNGNQALVGAFICIASFQSIQLQAIILVV